MSNNPYDAYQKTSVHSADGVTLTTMLFDGALKSMKKARLFHETGNREGYNNELNRSFLILGELLATLDMTQGEIPERLHSLYSYSMCRLVEATIQGPKKIAEVESLIVPVAEAWRVATSGLKGSAPATSMASAAA